MLLPAVLAIHSATHLVGAGSDRLLPSHLTSRSFPTPPYSLLDSASSGVHVGILSEWETVIVAYIAAAIPLCYKLHPDAPRSPRFSSPLQHQLNQLSKARMTSTSTDFWETYTFPEGVSFDAIDSGLLFSPKWLEPKTASCIAREDPNFNESDSEFTLFLTYSDHHFDTSEGVIRKFCSKWNLPASTHKWLAFWGRFDAVYSEPAGTLMCIWYELFVPRAVSGRIESRDSVRVCHMIDNQSRKSRTLVICSRELEAKARVSRQLHAHLTGNGRAAEAQIQPGWFTVHLVLASAVQAEIALEHFSRVQGSVAIAVSLFVVLIGRLSRSLLLMNKAVWPSHQEY